MEDMSPALKKRLMMLMMNPEFKGMPMDKLIEEAENQLRQDSFRSKEGPLLEAKDGGRVEYQTGGITESRTLPPEFIEAAQKTFLTDLARQSGIPSITTATTQQPGETAEQFAQRKAQALGVPGAFGGGREGVQRAEFDATSDLNRARLLADLRQRGFQSAAARRQQDLQNQLGIANLQSGLGARAQDFARAQISGLGTLGAGQQAQRQAELDAQRQAAQMAVQDPRDRLARFGQGIVGLTPGAGTVQVSPEAATAPSASPLATALGLGLAGADIYGRLFPRSN